MTDAAEMLSHFERLAKARVCISTLNDGDDADHLVTLAAESKSMVLAVVCDFSDSAHFTSRLLSRLPGLLRGWDRETTVWIYALGDVRPLPGIVDFAVGDLTDGTLDLAGTLANRSLIGKFNRRGSFIAPTLMALNSRAAAEDVRALRVIVLSDGRLSDFEPVPPAAADVLGLLEPDEDATVARTHWKRVMGDVPLYVVGDVAAQAWLSAWCLTPTQTRAIRLHGRGARHIKPASGRPVANADWFEWMPSQGPLLVLVPSVEFNAFRIDCRYGDQTAALVPSRLTATPAVADADLALARKTFYGRPERAFATLYDSLLEPAALNLAWQFASEASAAAFEKRTWPTINGFCQSDAAHRAVAMICLCNRPPDGPVMAKDRVVLFALMFKSEGLTIKAGDDITIGTLADDYAIQHDYYEDRWIAFINEKNKGITAQFALHPTASDHLPPMSMIDGTSWTGIFSGTLR